MKIYKAVLKHLPNEFSTVGWKSGQRSNISKGLLLTSYFLQILDTSASRTEKKINPAHDHMQAKGPCWLHGRVVKDKDVTSRPRLSNPYNQF